MKESHKTRVADSDILNKRLLIGTRVNCIETCIEVINAGADINYREPSSLVTPLHSAAYNGHFHICEFLLERGAGVNLKDKAGATPLHSSTYYGYRSICEILIKYGADVHIKDENSRSPYDIAKSNHYKHIEELFKSQIKNNVLKKVRDNLNDIEI